MQHSKIRQLDGDLFKDNPEIQHIRFWHSDIKNIGLNTFRDLPELTSLHFGHASCFNQETVNKQENIEALIDKLLTNCHPTVKMMEEDLFSGKEFEKAVDARIRALKTSRTGK